MGAKFSGGIALPHQTEHKEETANLPVQTFAPPQVVIPLAQGLAKPALPVVEPGQTVKKGELVGRADGKMSVPVHASVSGTVTAVENRPCLEGEGLCVVVENDGCDTPAPGIKHLPGAQGLRTLMREAGLIGMGGAGFPTAVKYETDKAIHWVLVNGCECEPYLTCDHQLMVRHADRVVAGAVALGQAAGAAVKICVESNKPDAVKKLREAALPFGVEILELPDRYPQGGERQLIQAAVGREVPEGGLPADVGAIVNNVATAAALSDAMAGFPLTHRLVTVAGQVAHPGNVYAPVGTLLSDLLAFCGGAGGEGLIAVFGGPMTGRVLDRLDVPMTKSTSGLMLLGRPGWTEQPCIRCGGCARVCPSRLQPFAIDAAVIAGRRDVCEALHAAQCISCGCCSYTCPAKRPLAARVGMAREGIRARARAAKR